MSTSHKAWLFGAAGAALIGCFFAASIFESRTKSPVFDEPAHIAAGLSYLETGIFRVNNQHPPLLKEMSALALRLDGIRWPKDAFTDALLHGDPEQVHGLEWPVGNAIIAKNNPDIVLLSARLPFVLLSSMLGFLIYFWGRQLVGPLAALGAVFLYVLDPTVLAHSFLVTMDAGFAAFTILFFFALWNYLRYPNWRRLLACGLALGGVLGTKFAALLLLPVAAVLLAAAVFWAVEHSPKRQPTYLDPYFFGTAPNDLCPCGSGKRFKRCHADNKNPTPVFRSTSMRMVACGCALLLMGVVAVGVIQLLYFSPTGPSLYIDGLRRVNADHDPNHRAFMAGQFAPRFTSYFVFSYLLKEPLASIVFVCVGLIVVMRSERFRPINKLFLLLPPLVLFAGHTIWADNLGIRYVIPALPFLYLIGGVGLAALIQHAAKSVRVLAVMLCAWIVVTTAAIYPDHLSYFNEAACLFTRPNYIGFDGGTRCGPLWFDDSNVDWGQGLKQLKVWLDAHARGQRVLLDAFTGFPPAGYGLPEENFDVDDFVKNRNVRPGLYVISAQSLTRVLASLGMNSWLLDTAPTAIVGHALYVYDIPAK